MMFDFAFIVLFLLCLISMFQFKSMEPKDFEEEMANKMRFERKMGKGKGSTPVSSPVRLKPDFTCCSLCHYIFAAMFGTVTVQGVYVW